MVTLPLHRRGVPERNYCSSLGPSPSVPPCESSSFPEGRPGTLHPCPPWPPDPRCEAPSPAWFPPPAIERPVRWSFFIGAFPRCLSIEEKPQRARERLAPMCPTLLESTSRKHFGVPGPAIHAGSTSVDQVRCHGTKTWRRQRRFVRKRKRESTMWHNGSRDTTGQRCARRKNRRRNVRPLLLERLEDRTLLSTYTVNGLGDTGSGLGLAGDLRYCVNLANANPGSTIQFGVTGAINLGSGLTISSNLTITGPGASSVAVKGGGSSSNFSVFTVNNSGVTASISGLTISNGNASFGGGVNNAGNLTLTNDTISGNSAQDGAGVYNSGRATLTNDTISGNSASYYGGVCNDNAGRATLTNDTISGNSASYYGGGVCNDNSGRATLTNDTISGNSADSVGGGVDNDGTATLTNVTLSGNSAYDGGGVCNDYHGTATLTNDTLSGNSAQYGGGVYNYYGTATLINDTLSGNSAYGSGGGLYNYS